MIFLMSHKKVKSQMLRMATMLYTKADAQCDKLATVVS